MNSIMARRASLFTVLGLLAVLTSSCGGGSDEEGAPAPLRLSADEITFTGPNSTSCGTGTALVYVYGGAAPYKIDNTWPTVMTVSKTQVNHPGESFELNVFNAGFCVAPATIVVTDARNRQVTLTVTTEVGDQ
ncbi:MAG: hypothetical protein AB1430_01665 [Pseudomonadota bacterium]